MSRVFAILTPGTDIRYGNDVVAGSDSIRPGSLVKFDTDGVTAQLAGASDDPDGIAFGSPGWQVYPSAPVNLDGNTTVSYTVETTTGSFSSGDSMTVVFGDFVAAVSEDFFTSGTLPSPGDTLYSAANGMMATSGTYAVGTVITTKTFTWAYGGTGTTGSVAVCRFEL